MSDIKAKRFQFLQKLYDESNQDELSFCEEYSIGNLLGFDKNATDKISQYLIQEGLIQRITMDGLIGITHHGICHVEEILEKRKQCIEKVITKTNQSIEKHMITAKDKRESEEGVLEPKPPEFLQKLLWIIKYGGKHWKIIVLAVIILGISLSIKFNLHNKIFNLFKNKTTISYERTNLYPRTKKRVYDISERIEEEKLNPWHFINIGKMRPVTKHDGRVISPNGVLFTDGLRLIFWSDDFIPPFIEDAIVQVFNETIEECHKNDLEPKLYIDEANRLLLGFILHIYARMADIDQKLCSTANSKKAGLRDTGLEVKKMRECLKEHYDAALLLASKGKALGETKISLIDKLINFFSAMDLWQKVVATLIAAFILALLAFLRRFFKNSPVIPITAFSDNQPKKEQVQTPISEKEKAGVQKFKHDIDHEIEDLEYRIEAVFADGKDLSESQILDRLDIPSYDKTKREQVQKIIGIMITSGKLEPSRYGGRIHRIRQGG